MNGSTNNAMKPKLVYELDTTKDQIWRISWYHKCNFSWWRSPAPYVDESASTIWNIFQFNSFPAFCKVAPEVDLVCDNYSWPSLNDTEHQRRGTDEVVFAVTSTHPWPEKSKRYRGGIHSRQVSSLLYMKNRATISMPTFWKVLLTSILAYGRWMPRVYRRRR